MGVILDKLAVIGIAVVMVLGGLCSCKRYATDYYIENGKTEYDVYDGWNVTRREDNGQVYLDVWHSGSDKTPEEKCWFRVYDSAPDAMKAFGAMKESYENYCGLQEEGANWFTGEEPGVCDATIEAMVYLQGNMIIIVELNIWGEGFWAEDDDGEWVLTGGGSTDNSYLKDYVLEKASELEDLVMEDILGY